MYILIPITDTITPTRHATSNTMPIGSPFVSNIVNYGSGLPTSDEYDPDFLLLRRSGMITANAMTTAIPKP